MRVRAEANPGPVLSGIQPTGDIHIGNYIGALRHWVALQEDHRCFFLLVDLHAITMPHDVATLAARTLETAALLLACGIDSQRSALFVQSHVPQHAELAWVLNCITPFGDLRRMTQFKDKSAEQREASASVGLFDYPVLQAADILLYQAEYVPVGEDQRQHLELTRRLAQQFNRRFGPVFTVPQALIPPMGARIMDLQAPTAKMSKSARSAHGTIRLTDPPEAIRAKIRAAVTDSGREVAAGPTKPALTNLLTLYSVICGLSLREAEAAFAGKSYSQFKATLGDALVEYLRPIRERFRELMANPEEIRRRLAAGSERARSAAAPTLAEVYKRVGFLPR